MTKVVKPLLASKAEFDKIQCHVLATPKKGRDCPSQYMPNVKTVDRSDPQ